MTDVVHILFHGVTPCGMRGLPGSWPTGHKWIGYGDPEQANVVTCPECIAARDAGGLDRVYAVGAPANPALRAMVEGCRTLACELCGRPTIFAPSSLTHPAAREATFICVPCLEGLQSKGQPIPVEVTPEQLRELRRAGIPDPEAHAARVLEQFGVKK